MKGLLPALLGGLALLLALAFGSGALAQGAGDAAALKQIMGDALAGPNERANAYMRGLAAYAAGDYAAAAEQLRAALPAHGTFARHWLALSLERMGQPQAGRAVLDVTDAAELGLYGDILLREWRTVPAADKQSYLALLQQYDPAAILPYAGRLTVAGYPVEAEAWVRATPDFATLPEGLVTLGSALYNQGRPAEAKPLLARAYALQPDTVTAYWYAATLAALAESGKGQPGDTAQAAALIAAAVAAGGEGAYSDIMTMLWPQASEAQKAEYLAQLQAEAPERIGPMALQLYDRQAYTDAVAWAKLALTGERSPEALLVLGQDAFRGGDRAAAAEWFRQAYELRAAGTVTGTVTGTLTGYWYGRTLALGPQPARGVEVLEPAIAALAADDRLLPWLLRDLGIAEARSGQCAEAAATFARAVEIDPGAENRERIAAASAEYGAACTPPPALP